MTAREKIVSATSDYFLREGCRKVTMDEIAAINGMSKRTIYENFEGKNALVEACVNHVNGLVHDKFEEQLDKFETFTDFFNFIHSGEVSTYMDNLKRFMIEIEKYYPTIFRNCTPVIKSYHCSEIAKVLLKGRDAGIILEGTDVDVQSEIVEELLNAVVKLDAAGEEKEAHHRHKTMLITYARGLSTVKGREIIDYMTSSCGACATNANN